MSFRERIDATTIEDLVAKGSLKWTTFPGAIGAWVAEMDFGIPSQVAEVLDEVNRRELTCYAPYPWRDELREVTARYQQQRYGWQVSADQVRLMPDVLSALAFMMHTWFTPGASIVVPTPCYMPFIDMPAAFGHKLVQVPMIRRDDGWSMDYEKIGQEMSGGNSLLVLCNPHNPIGKVYTRAELETLCDVVQDAGGWVFSDEIHAPITYSGVTHIPYASISEQAAGHTLTAVAASKAFNIPGLKSAQIILTADKHIDFFRAHDHGVPYGPGTSGVVASTVAYRECADWLDQVLAYLESNRDRAIGLVNELLPEATVIAPEATYLMWLDLRAYGRHAYTRVLKAGVACNDGATCGAGFDGFLRFNFAMPQPILDEAFGRIASALTGRD